MDRGRFLILEGQGPVQGVTVYEFPTKDAARNWHNNVRVPALMSTAPHRRRTQMPAWCPEDSCRRVRAPFGNK
jgi:hypothetical protein